MWCVYLCVAQGQEDVSQQHQGAGGQAVQVLRVGHLQRLTQAPLGVTDPGRGIRLI